MGPLYFLLDLITPTQPQTSTSFLGGYTIKRGRDPSSYSSTPSLLHGHVKPYQWRDQHHPLSPIAQTGVSAMRFSLLWSPAAKGDQLWNAFGHC